MVLIHRLTQVTQDPIVQGASPVSIIGKGRHEDCRYRVARVDKAPVEFEPGHGRHMDVGDQAGCFGKPRGGEKIGCRRENVDRIAQRSHEPAHGLTKEPIIFNDRNQYLFHHTAHGRSLDASAGDNYPIIVTLRIELLDI
jgi:hypothetical protein